MDFNNTYDASGVDVSNDVNTTPHLTTTAGPNETTDVYPRFRYIADVVNCVHFVIAVVAVVIGSFVVDVVRKLNDDELRSRFALLAVLIFDIVLAASNFTVVGSFFTLVEGRMNLHLTCPFVYINTALTALLTNCLALSLLCLAVDQVVAVFRPMYFRMVYGSRWKIVYGVIIISPVPLLGSALIYRNVSLDVDINDEMYCNYLTLVMFEIMQYAITILCFVIVSTPVIYGIVFCKIARQTHVPSEHAFEHVKNRKLIVTFFMLSASYFLLWIPTLAYFLLCFFKDTCWNEDTMNVSLVMHIIFTFNYMVDPLICAIRMEPVNRRFRKMFSRG